VVDSSSNIQSKLHQRHTALSFHRVPEAVAAKITCFFHISCGSNSAEILSKHWHALRYGVYFSLWFSGML